MRLQLFPWTKKGNPIAPYLVGILETPWLQIAAFFCYQLDYIYIYIHAHILYIAPLKFNMAQKHWIKHYGLEVWKNSIILKRLMIFAKWFHPFLKGFPRNLHPSRYCKKATRATQPCVFQSTTRYFYMSPPLPKKQKKHSFPPKTKKCKLRRIAISFVTPWGTPAVSHYEDLQLSLNVNQRQPKKFRPRLRCTWSSHPQKNHYIDCSRDDDVLAYINSWNIFWAWWFVFIFKFLHVIFQK